MRRKRKYIKKKTKQKTKQKRGKGVPYIYNNKIYLGTKPQKGSAAVWKLISRLLENVGDVIGL